MQEASDRLFIFAQASFARGQCLDVGLLSPYLPCSMYQAGIVQYRTWKRNGDMQCKERLDIFMDILRFFNQRWLIGSECLSFSYSLNFLDDDSDNLNRHIPSCHREHQR
jgi:hypothetical protein